MLCRLGANTLLALLEFPLEFPLEPTEPIVLGRIRSLLFVILGTMPPPLPVQYSLPENFLDADIRSMSHEQYTRWEQRLVAHNLKCYSAGA